MAYGTDEGLTDWLEVNGYDLDDAGTPPFDVLRQRASVYIDAKYGAKFSGSPTGGVAQARAWPRTGVTIYGAELADDLIPAAVEEATYAAAYREGLKPGTLTATLTADPVLKSKSIAGVIDKEWFEPTVTTTAAALPSFSEVDSLMAPYVAPAKVVLFGSVVRA